MYGPSGTRQQAFSHYSVRAGLDSERTKWSERALDVLMEDYGFENWGTSGHHYGYLGWGTLTKRLGNWMAGDPGTFADGDRISGYHSVPCTINATDYDYYAGNGEGHTYHNEGTVKSQLYRTDGTIEIMSDGDGYAITDMASGEWMNYSVIFPAPENNTKSGLSGKYKIYATYKSSADGAKLYAAVGSDANRNGKELAAADDWTETCLGTFEVEYGAAVVRIYVEGESNLLQLKNIRIQVAEDSSTSGIDSIDMNDNKFMSIINGNTISISRAERIEAYSITGVKKATAASNQITLPNGMYLLKATADGKTKVAKIGITR